MISPLAKEIYDLVSQDNHLDSSSLISYFGYSEQLFESLDWLQAEGYIERGPRQGWLKVVKPLEGEQWEK